MQSEMEKLYQKETGKSAWGHWGPDDCTDEYHGHLRMYVEGPTIEYSAWLEERASKNSMESGISTSTNKGIPKCKTCKHADKSKRESFCQHNYTAGTKGCFALRQYL